MEKNWNTLKIGPGYIESPRWNPETFIAHLASHMVDPMEELTPESLIGIATRFQADTLKPLPSRVMAYMSNRQIGINILVVWNLMEMLLGIETVVTLSDGNKLDLPPYSTGLQGPKEWLARVLRLSDVPLQLQLIEGKFDSLSENGAVMNEIARAAASRINARLAQGVWGEIAMRLETRILPFGLRRIVLPPDGLYITGFMKVAPFEHAMMYTLPFMEDQSGRSSIATFPFLKKLDFEQFKAAITGWKSTMRRDYCMGKEEMDWLFTLEGFRMNYEAAVMNAIVHQYRETIVDFTGQNMGLIPCARRLDVYGSVWYTYGVSNAVKSAMGSLFGDLGKLYITLGKFWDAISDVGGLEPRSSLPSFGSRAAEMYI